MKKTAIKLIKWYQTKISPNKGHKCRHKPTCSNYALEAYERHNFFYASFLSLKRILSCNPLFKPKYDPVPKKKIQRKLIKSHFIYSRLLNEKVFFDIYLPKVRKTYFKVVYLIDKDNSQNLNTLIKEKGITMMIVKIPYDNKDLIINEIKPYIDYYFNALTDLDNTYITYDLNNLEGTIKPIGSIN